MVRRVVVIVAVVCAAMAAYAEEPLQRGVASFYAADFHGKKTASGETFDMNARTAAHRDLPFGTMLRVVDEDTKKETIVRVNDRGPFVKDRIIDLSYQAAVDLGIVKKGTARVAIYVIGKGDGGPASGQALELPGPSIAKPVKPGGSLPEPEAPGSSLAGTKTREPKAGDIVCKIQVGAFSSEANAKALYERLEHSGFSPTYEQAKAIIRVVIDRIPESELDAVQRRLGELGYRRLVIQKYRVL